VGRSSYQSFCFLFTDSEAEKSLERLSFFEKNNDGFKLAEFDLSQRGPGEVYGTAQSGALRFKFASLRDTDIIKTARELASGLEFEKYPTLKNKVKEWESVVHLE
jgi:ATP-dependent DNA helicase RecG